MTKRIQTLLRARGLVTKYWLMKYPNHVLFNLYSFWFTIHGDYFSCLLSLYICFLRYCYFCYCVTFIKYSVFLSKCMYKWPKNTLKLSFNFIFLLFIKKDYGKIDKVITCSKSFFHHCMHKMFLQWRDIEMYCLFVFSVCLLVFIWFSVQVCAISKPVHLL